MPVHGSDRNRSGVAFGVLLGLLCWAGCSPEDAPHEADAHQEHDHRHDHGIPDHKPETFAAAVTQLPKRHRRIAAEFKAGHGDAAAHEIQELLDLVRWLPELAADTELRKSDWETVQRTAADFERLILCWRSAISQDQESFQILELMSELKPLAAKTISKSDVVDSGEPNPIPTKHSHPHR